MAMIIIGAGLSGLLAAHYFRHFKPVVYEAAPGPVDNHHALLRFRSSAITDLTGAKTREVFVNKAVLGEHQDLRNETTLKDCNAYSYKVTGQFMDRSITDLNSVRRWVAGPNFMTQLRQGVEIKYSTPFHPAVDRFCEGTIVISTMPIHHWLAVMPTDAPQPTKSYAITALTCEIDNCDLNQTVYLPYGGTLSHFDNVYRASFVGSRFIVELLGDCSGRATLEGERIIDRLLPLLLGVALDQIDRSQMTVHVQKHGKIVEFEPHIRRKVISQITRDYGVFSLGRFACWRNSRVDDILKDLVVINKLIEQGDYAKRLHYAKAPAP